MNTEYLEQNLEDIIKNVGFAITSTCACNGKPFHVYTVGLEENFNHPEICVVGIPPQAGQYILNYLFFTFIMNGSGSIDVPFSTKQFCMETEFPVVFTNVNDNEKYNFDYLYEKKDTKFNMIQVLLSDKEGFFPFETECKGILAEEQLILGNIDIVKFNEEK